MLALIDRKKLVEDLKEFYPEHLWGTVAYKIINEQPVFNLDKAVGQIMWERDMAFKQLEDYGVGFGEEAELQRVKRGKWIKDQPYYTSYGAYIEPVHCSECNWHEYEATKYCADCGAKMEE